jgi:hypothetical protein
LGGTRREAARVEPEAGGEERKDSRMNQVNEWGPAVLVCFTVLIGIVMNNRGIDALNKRMDDLRSEMIARFEGLEKRLVDRIERLEHPVSRP